MSAVLIPTPQNTEPKSSSCERKPSVVCTRAQELWQLEDENAMGYGTHTYRRTQAAVLA